MTYTSTDVVGGVGRAGGAFAAFCELYGMPAVGFFLISRSASVSCQQANCERGSADFGLFAASNPVPTLRMKLVFTIERDDETGAFTASWDDPEGGGITTQAFSFAELSGAITEAVRCHFTERRRAFCFLSA
jgi:hypothetical protein